MVMSYKPVKELSIFHLLYTSSNFIQCHKLVYHVFLSCFCDTLFSNIVSIVQAMFLTDILSYISHHIKMSVDDTPNSFSYHHHADTLHDVHPSSFNSLASLIIFFKTSPNTFYFKLYNFIIMKYPNLFTIIHVLS